MSRVGKQDFGQSSHRVLGYLSLSDLNRDGYREQVGTWFAGDGDFMVDIWILHATERKFDWTVLTTVHDGRMVRRSWRRAWARHTLPSLCRQFQEDLALAQPLQGEVG